MIFFTSTIYITSIIYSLIILFVFLLFKNVVTNTIIKLIKKLADKYNLKGIVLMIDSIEKPLRNFFLYTGIFIAVSVLPLIPSIKIFINRVYRTCIIISVSQCLLNLVSAYSVVINNTYIQKSGKVLLSKTLFPLLSKILKALIIVVAVVAIASEFNFKQLQSLLAGLGIGGAALALASQDLIKNFFGGFVVLSDRSFSVGDWIKIESNEGTVEELGLRSTKIRTIDKEIVVVPNAKFTDGAVINYTYRQNRRANFIIGITYNTSREKLQAVIDKIKSMLDSNPMVKRDSSLVKFDKFNTSSLDIIIQYLTNTADYNEFMYIKNDINFEIMRILEEEEVEFAFPSMSVYIEKN